MTHYSLQDILYCYPKDAQAMESEEVGARRRKEKEVKKEGRKGVRSLLKQLRGVFLTLSDIMASITEENKSW